MAGASRGILASAEVWDPATASFSPAGSLDEARFRHTATPLPDGRILVLGGDDDDLRRLASAEVWDPATASFSPAGSLAKARDGTPPRLLPDGRVLVAGGIGKNWNALASAFVWDPATASFVPTDALAEARDGHTATLLPDGRVLVVGGKANGFLASAEVWDPATATFGPTGSLVEPRGFHTATLLPDGRVLVVGGAGEGEDAPPLATAEVWDPATGTFSPSGSLVEKREDHTATLLPDGRVLVIGGDALGISRGGLGPGDRHVRACRSPDRGESRTCP